MHSGGFELTKLTYYNTVPGSRITWYALLLHSNYTAVHGIIIIVFFSLFFFILRRMSKNNA